MVGKTPEVARQYAADHFGEIVVGLATTYYVVFTYYLLRSAEQQVRRLLQPMLSINWSTERDVAPQSMPRYQDPARAVAGWLTELGDASVTIDQTQETDRRYVALRLRNLRDLEIAWIELVTRQVLRLPGQQEQTVFVDSLRLPGPRIDRTNTLDVTVLDLRGIPVRAHIDFTVTLRYASVDEGIVMERFHGDSTYTTQGVSVLRARTPAPVEQPGEGA